MLGHSLSVCVLLYGDHVPLARRCLDSILVQPGYLERVADFRLGLNHVSQATHDYACQWAKSSRKPVRFYQPVWPPGSPSYKYPVLRRMLREGSPPASWLMWFDDDSYLTGTTPDWWQQLGRLLDSDEWDVIGPARHFRPMAMSQWLFITSQPWFNRQMPYIGEFHFVQGGWWCARTSFLLQHNWPIPELKHNGGDALFGELCRHTRARVKNWHDGVRFNADKFGENSKSIPRGCSSFEEQLARDYTGQPLPTDHQEFKLRSWVWNSPTT